MVIEHKVPTITSRFAIASVQANDTANILDKQVMRQLCLGRNLKSGAEDYQMNQKKKKKKLYLPDLLLDQVMESINVTLRMTIPEGLWQKLTMELDNTIIRAHSVVQLWIVKPVVVVGIIIKSKKTMYKCINCLFVCCITWLGCTVQSLRDRSRIQRVACDPQ